MNEACVPGCRAEFEIVCSCLGYRLFNLSAGTLSRYGVGMSCSLTVTEALERLIDQENDLNFLAAMINCQ